MLEGGFTPAISPLGLLDGGMQAHGCRGLDTPCRTLLVRAKSGCSAGSNKVAVCGPSTHDDAQRGATGRPAGHEPLRRAGLGQLAIAGVCLHDQQAEGRERAGTAGMEKAEVADFHTALGSDVLEEPAEKPHDVEVGSAWACTAHFPVGEGDRALCEADKTLVGDSDLEDIGGEGGEGGAAMVIRLTVDVPGDGPALGGNGLEPSGLAHLFFAERTVDGGEGFDGDKEVGSGGAPGRAVLGEATARDDVVDRRVVLELPAPGMQDTGAPRELGPDEALIVGQPLEGRCRCLQQGLVSNAWLRADKGTQGLRDSEGEKKVRPRELFVQVRLEPLLRFMLLALGTVPVATGTIDAVFFPTALALIEAVAVMAALALLDGTDGLTVCRGEGGRALQVLRGKSRADIAESRHGSSPCMRALRRS